MSITPEIIHQCICDDRKAINFMYEHCFHLLMPVCFRYNNNEVDAQASYNTGFIKILKALEKVENGLNFNAWAKRVMINTLIDEYRKNMEMSEGTSKWHLSTARKMLRDKLERLENQNQRMVI